MTTTKNPEAWRSLAAGMTVDVVRPTSNTERMLLGMRLEVTRIDATHGYAVCSDGRHSWHLHPEALERVEP